MTPYIIGIVVGAILIYLKRNYSNALALLKNLKTEKELLEKDKEKNKNNVEIDVLTKQLEDLKKKIKEGKLTDEELAKWFTDSFDDK